MPIVTAIAAALHGDNCPDDPDEGCVCCVCYCDWGHWERQAQVAYAAAHPLIEAEVRERYAQRILAADADYGYRLNADDAAEILRAGQ